MKNTELKLGVMAGSIVILGLVSAALLMRSNTLDETYLGLPDDFYQASMQSFAAKPEAFEVQGDDKDHSKDNVRLYLPVRQLRAPTKPLGKDHWVGPQQTGDCVGCGEATAIVHTLAAAIAAGGGEVMGEPFPSACYALARHVNGQSEPSCGHGGAYPTAAAEAFEKSGWVTFGEVNLPYSGATSDKWGCQGLPRELIPVAAARAGGQTYPIRTLEEWWNALGNFYATTVAIPWQPGATFIEGNRRCIGFNGRKRGGHQLACIAYDGSGIDGKKYWLLMNSHGEGWPANSPPMQDEPKGTCWINERWAQWVLDNGVVIAYSSVKGFEPQKIDWDKIFGPSPN